MAQIKRIKKRKEAFCQERILTALFHLDLQISLSPTKIVMTSLNHPQHLSVKRIVTGSFKSEG